MPHTLSETQTNPSDLHPIKQLANNYIVHATHT